MKYAVLLVAGAALTLGACQNSEEPAAEATAAAPADAAVGGPVGAAAAFTAGQPPSKEFMTGIWGEGDECELGIDFQADGTIKDGPFDAWKIEGDQLVMDDLVKLKLTVVDAETMTSQAEGSDETNTLKRCAAVPPPPAG